MSAPAAIPAGYWRDHRDRLVPIENVDPVDALRDELVRGIAEQARTARADLAALKRRWFDQVESFLDLASAEYDAALGGRRGNLQLVSYDGRLRVIVQVQDRITFDERLHAAQALVEECLIEWTDGARSELRALVAQAFEAGQDGSLSTSRLLGLLRLSIPDARWGRAMAALRDSIRVLSTTRYIRVYERSGPQDAWAPITLDFAAL